MCAEEGAATGEGGPPPAEGSDIPPDSAETPAADLVAYQPSPAPQAPYFPPPPPARRRRRFWTFLIVGVVAIVVLGALGGGGAALANASLSSTYSPQRAVTDYFAAQARGDVDGMMSNATF